MWQRPSAGWYGAGRGSSPARRSREAVAQLVVESRARHSQAWLTAGAPELLSRALAGLGKHQAAGSRPPGDKSARVGVRGRTCCSRMRSSWGRRGGRAACAARCGCFWTRWRTCRSPARGPASASSRRAGRALRPQSRCSQGPAAVSRPPGQHSGTAFSQELHATVDTLQVLAAFPYACRAADGQV